MILNFDQSIPVHLILRQRDNYDKLFLVKKNGVDYDWANVTEVILEVKKSKSAADKIIELKKSSGGIETNVGQMIFHLPPGKTDIEPGDYSSLELLILFESSKPKLWFDGSCTVKPRSIQVV
ncbi:MAG: hypothetical protein KGZ42_07615 [Melioribacter sp.]|nr:hypothetical protein [Melioribacter sp.]